MFFEAKRVVATEIAVLDSFFDALFIIDSILTFFIPDVNLEGKSDLYNL